MKKAFACMVAVLFAVVMSSCHKSDLSSNVSYIMFVNGCPDSIINLELTLNSGSNVAPMQPYMATSGYQYIIPGADNFDVFSSADTTLLTFAATLANGGYYSVFAGGLLQKPSVFVLADNLVTPTGSNASVRLINACSDTSTAFITGVATSTSGNTTFGSGVAFKTSSGFTTLSAGAYSLKVTGANAANEKDTSNVQFAAGKIYTIMYSGINPKYNLTVISNN